MDPHFGALFGQIQTKTVHRVLSPIANRVSQLVLFHEAREVSAIQNGGRDAGEASDAGRRLVSADLPVFTRDINAALKGLTAAALEGRDLRDTSSLSRGVDATPTEEMDMSSACRDLLIAGESLAAAASTVTLTAKLGGDAVVEASTRPQARSERARLVEAAKHVLRQTLRVLLVADRQEVRRLMRLFDRSTELFVHLLESRNLKELVPRFKSFTDHLLEVSDAVETRSHELTSASRSEALAASLMTLQRTPHTLCGAMQTFIKYPENVQARLSHDYASSLFIDVVDELKNLLRSENVDEELESGGNFQKRIDEALEALLPNKRLELDSDFDTLTESIVRHSMTVLHFTMDEAHKSALIKTSDRLLRLKNRVADYCNNVLDNPSFKQLHRDFDYLCEKLADDFKDLESVVNAAVLKLLVETFLETHEPLDRLIKAAMMSTSKDVASGGSSKGVASSTTALVNFEEYAEDFCAHAEALAMVASFAAASSSDTRRVFLLTSSVRRLEAMDPEVVPAVEALRRDADDAASLEHLRMLKIEWKESLESISSLLDEMMDARAFFETSFAALKERIGVLRAAFASRDSNRVLRTSRALGAMGRRVARVGRLVVNRCADPVFRNGLMAYVTRMEKAADELKRATRKATSTETMMSARGNDDPLSAGADEEVESAAVGKEGAIFARARDRAMKKAYHVVDCAHRVLLGLNAENHPDMMSPLRQVARGQDIERRRRRKPPTKENDRKETGLGRSIAKIFDKTDINESSFHDNLFADDALRRLPFPFAQAGDDAHSTSLGRALVRASISGDSAKMDLLCRRIAAWTNHLTEVGDDVCPHVTSHVTRETLDSLTRALTDCAPSLLDQAKKVHRGEINKLEELHRVGGQWDRDAILLKDALDRELKFWDRALTGMKSVVGAEERRDKRVSGNVDVEAGKIKDIGQSWIQVVNMCLACSDTTRFSGSRRRLSDSLNVRNASTSSSAKENLRRDLRQHLKLLPRLTQQLAVAAAASEADVGSARDRRFRGDNFGFSRCCREWTAGFFVMIKRVDEALWNEMERLGELEKAVLNGDPSKTNSRLADMREWIGKYEKMVVAVAEDGEDDDDDLDRGLRDKKKETDEEDTATIEKIRRLGKEIRLLSSALGDVVKTVIADKRTCGIYDDEDGADENGDLETRLRSTAPLIQKMAILLRAMAAKVAALSAELDVVVEETTPPVDDLLGTLFALLGRGLGVSTDASPSSLRRDFEHRSDAFIERMIRAKRRTRELFEALIAVGQHENAHRIAMALESFSDVTQRFTTFLTSLTDVGADLSDAAIIFQRALSSRGAAEMLRREWACHARSLLRTLAASPGVTYGSLDEIRQLVLGSKTSNGRRRSSLSSSRKSSFSSSSMDDVNFALQSRDDDAAIANGVRAEEAAPLSPPSPTRQALHFATPSTTMRKSLRSTPYERRQLKSLTPLMLSTKFSTALPSTADYDDARSVFTSTPIVERERREAATNAASSSALSFATPLGGTPIKRKNALRRDDGANDDGDRMKLKSRAVVASTGVAVSSAHPSFGLVDELKEEARMSIVSANATTSQEAPSAKRSSPVSSLNTADMKDDEEDIEAKIFIDDDPEADPPLPPPPPPPPPFCAITMTPNSTRKIADAASFLQRETEKYGADATKENVVMKSANDMSLRMRDIADFFHFSHRHLRSRPASSSGGSEGRNNLSADDADDEDEENDEPAIRSKEDLLAASRAISANGDVVVRFAKTIARLCADHATSKDLLYYANQIPTLSTQLTILASVKAASSLASDHSLASDAVIVKNVQNLTQAVARTLRAAEGACMQGLPSSASPSSASPARESRFFPLGDSAAIAASPKGLSASAANGSDVTMAEEAVALSLTWRQHLMAHRQSEASSSVLDDLGLRRVDTSKTAPKLVELLTI